MPDTEICATAGVIAAGADCVHTRTAETRQMTLPEFIEYLEPQPARPDPKDPAKTLPERGAAICQSAQEWMEMKNVMEQACELLGKRCSYEFREAMARVEALQTRVMEKRPRPEPLPAKP